MATPPDCAAACTLSRNSLTCHSRRVAWRCFTCALTSGDAPVKRWLLPMLLLLLLPLLTRGQAPDSKAIDRIVADAMKTFKAPGMALVIVHNDKVVYLEGAGV